MKGLFDMETNIKKIVAISSVALLLFGNMSPVFALSNSEDEMSNVEYVQEGTTGDVYTFSNSDVLQAAENLYNQGLFTEEQYRIVFFAYAQRLGVKGVNKVVNLGNGLTDVYINNVTWSAMVGLGGGAAGLLLGAIPGLNAGVAAMIGAVGGAAGSAYLGAERGVIVRMKQVYEPPTQISGAKLYPKVIGIRGQ
ncbi:hypothetical protein [Streptococcus suis]